MLTSSGNNKKLGPGPQSDDVVTENRWSWRMFRSFTNICSNVATFNTTSIKFWTQPHHTWPFYYFPGFLSIAPWGWTRSSSMGSIWTTPWPSIMPRRLVLSSQTVLNLPFFQYENLGFELTKARLIDLGYPQEIANLKYNRNFPVRGLWWDNVHGNLLKVDGFGNILFACHGKKFLKP